MGRGRARIGPDFHLSRRDCHEVSIDFFREEGIGLEITNPDLIMAKIAGLFTSMNDW